MSRFGRKNRSFRPEFTSCTLENRLPLDGDMSADTNPAAEVSTTTDPIPVWDGSSSDGGYWGNAADAGYQAALVGSSVTSDWADPAPPVPIAPAPAY